MSRGGSRFGAGRPAYRAKAENLMRLDIRVWHKQGLLRSGVTRSWSWSRSGKPAGSIRFSIDDSQIRFMYSINGSDASQTISRTSTPCHFGGSRQWFCCPICQKRTALLYMRSARFACRACQKVAYSSQSEDVMDRMVRKQNQIETSIKENAKRPRGMRQSTMKLLFARLEDSEQRWGNALYAKGARLFGRDFKNDLLT